MDRGAWPAVFLPQQPHAWLEFLHDFRRAIRRAIVHNDDFTLRRRKVLLQHAHDRLLDQALVVVRVNQYADKTSRQISAPRESFIPLPGQTITIRSL